MSLVNLDMDVLRTFVAGVDLGSFAKAAERVGRSPSAISMQLRKLEEQVGQPLVRKDGRSLALTEAGESLLSYARRLLDLNDEALMAARSSAVSGSVRLGLPPDFAETWLPGVLARFARVHPDVHVEARVDRNATLLAGLATGALDIALLWGGSEQDRRGEKLADLQMSWIGPASGFVRDPAAALPLVAFDLPCVFRQAGVAALDAVGVSWRVAFSSPGLSGLWAAVSAGLGVTPRTAQGLPVGVKPLDAKAAGLPELPQIGLFLRMADSQPSPAASLLKVILRETLKLNLGATSDVMAPQSAQAISA
ncbi:LysR substrate-binding domain-containing protein [Rhodoblastus sp.]|jgi:DNA-binding transcriptional LysR family regulator|uniref:LysR substrate-binding domain-containing protein n=1 Tax=Rhodoblastus sp. TaxID=1962975 RepID=UPI0025EF1D9A|nr:LysR substrate-binding domain-containing protein [Rhodoblastus sp.]